MDTVSNNKVFCGVSPSALDQRRKDITNALYTLPVLSEAVLRRSWDTQLRKLDNDIYKRMNCAFVVDFLIEHLKNDAEITSLFVPEVQSVTVDCEFNTWGDKNYKKSSIRVLSLPLIRHGGSYFLRHNVCRPSPNEFEICYQPPEEVVYDPNLKEMRKLARQLLEEHGNLVEVRCLSKRPCRIDLVFADGYENSIGDHSGGMDISLIKFGYAGTGPTCFHIFLHDTGFRLSYHEISQIEPGTIIRPSKEHLKIMEILLAKGAVNVKRTYADGKTPLLIAAEKGDAETVKTLLAKGADVNSKDYDENTPLLIAAEKGDAEIVEDLLAKGADINSRNYANETPLHLAAGKGHTEIVKILLDKGAEVDARGYMDRTPLMLAANCSIDTVTSLLSKGADVNAKTISGMTPLMWAARRKGQTETVKALLIKGADVNDKTDEGRTALYYAELFGGKQTEQLLRDVASGTSGGKIKSILGFFAHPLKS